MADHTISIDVIDLTVRELNPINIAIINLPNPVTGYSANAKEVRDLIQIPKYTIYESGTSNVINGTNYFDYFPEEGGGGGGGGMTPEEVRTIVSDMTDSEVSDVSTNPIQNKVIKEYVDENKVTVDSVISETSTNAIQNGVMTNFVNSSISTATSTFRGTFNSKQALDETSGDKNDYAFLVTTDSAGNTLYNRYKFVEAESGLPEGYTPLLYISNGNTHPIIDTGIVPNIHTGFYIKFNPGDPVSWGQCYFGATSDSNFGTVDWKYSENNDHHQLFEIFRSGAELTNTSHNSINEIVYSYPYITANNGTQQQVRPDDAIFTRDITIALFGLHYYSIGNYHDGVDNVQLYSFKLFDGSGNALRDFVPCKNDQNEVGLYDKVSETFFGNVKDSGVFIAGPNDTGHWEFEYSLNNSSFTSEQWAAINSGIKSQDVTKIGNLKPVATSGQYSDLEGTPTLGTAAAQNVEAFATAAQGGKADTAIQSAGAGLTKDGTALKHTNSVAAKTTQTFAKVSYDAQGHITGSTAATTAQNDAIDSGIDSTKVSQIETNKNNILFNAQNGVVNMTNISDITLSSDGYLANRVGFNASAGTYRLKSSISGGTAKYTVVARKGNTEVYRDDTAIGSPNIDHTFTLSTATDSISIWVQIQSGTPAISNTMIYPAAFGDIPYQPYAMSNAELTAKVQTNITIIWDYNANNNGEIPYEPFTSTLSDNINNYDAIQLEMVSYRDDLDDPSWNATMFSPIIPVYVLNNSLKNNYFNHTSFETRSTNWYIKDTTVQKIATNQSNTNGLVRVYGIKF